MYFDKRGGTAPQFYSQWKENRILVSNESEHITRYEPTLSKFTENICK